MLQSLSMRAPELIDILLEKRGITDPTVREHFLNPSYERDLHDPFLLPDMEKSVERILNAIAQNEKIVVYSDYDADGIPGAVILHDFFTSIKYQNVSYYIPHRHDEGYGLHADAIETFHTDGVQLVITIDLGTTAVEPIANAQKYGIDIIVTDHHIAPPVLPNAFAIINPHLAHSKYPEAILCGAGVAFKLACALIQKKDDHFGLPVGYEKWFLDMTAIATLADMVPLVGENRALAYFGMKVLRKTRRAGLQHLLHLSGTAIDRLTEEDVTFTIAPRINAASRLENPRIAFDMLRDPSPLRSHPHAIKLQEINDRRKTLVASIMKEAKKVLTSRDVPKVLVLGNPKWHVGVLGLVAGKLCEEYQRPVFVWGEGGDGHLRGSCRSDGSVNLVHLMESIKDHFHMFGGHEGAGGFTVTRTHVHALEDALGASYDTLKITVTNTSGIVADTTLSLADVNRENTDAIALLAPYGVGNPKPVFRFAQVVPHAVRQFGKTKEHLEVMFADADGTQKKAIAFFAKATSFKTPLVAGISVDLFATFDDSEYAGRKELRLKIVEVE